MKHKLMALLLLTGSAAFAQFSVGIRIGPPPPPRVVHVVPTAPGPGYTWVEGYWYPVGSHYRWHEGYWTRPAYEGARWIGPRYDGGQFYQGYWEGSRGNYGHDHRWDKDHHERDHRWERDHDHH